MISYLLPHTNSFSGASLQKKSQFHLVYQSHYLQGHLHTVHCVHVPLSAGLHQTQSSELSLSCHQLVQLVHT